MDLVILAAGMGSRFGGLKQIEPMNKNNEFIIDYSIYDAIKYGFNKVVFIIKEENYEIFRETIGKRVEKYIAVKYVFQKIDNLPKGFTIPKGREKPWGTGHAILCCKDVVKDNFVMINSDDFYGEDAFKVAANFIKRMNNLKEYGLVGYKVCNTLAEHGAVKRGVCKVTDGYLEELVESSIEEVNGKILATALSSGVTKEISKDTIVSMNMLIFTPKIFERLEKTFPNKLEQEINNGTINKFEFLIPDVVFEQVQDGEVTVEVLNTDAKWYGVTYKADKHKVVSAINDMVEDGKYPSNLWNR